MKFELKIIPENERELLHIAAKLRDIESLVTDSIPFFPDDPSIYSTSEATDESEQKEYIPTKDEMLQRLNSFAEEKGPDALKKILQGFGVFRFSELPEDKWLEVLKMMELHDPENKFSNAGDKQEENR